MANSVIDRRYSVAEGTAIKAPCLVATTANITLGGLQAIDGVTVAEHHRVLVKNQTDQKLNGIYEASTGNWLRTKDFDGAYDIVHGTKVYVASGSTNLNTEYTVTSPDPIVIGTSAIIFSGAGDAILATAAAAAAAASASAVTAAATAAGVASTIGGFITPNVAAAIAATIPSAVTGITIMGYYVEGDTAPAIYKKVGSMPAVFGKLQSHDGAWWQIVNGDHINVQHYGAKPSSSDADKTINAAAFHNAVADLPANGGTILIPPGRYHTEGPLADLLDKFGIEFVGAGSSAAGVGASEVVYTGDGSDGSGKGKLINLDGTRAITFRNLVLSYNSASYAADIPLIKVRQISSLQNTTGTLFEDCSTRGWNTSAKNATLYDIGAATLTTFKRGFMHNANTGIIGAVGVGDFSNIVVIDGTQFDAPMKIAVLIGGNSWSLMNITGEPLQGTTGGAALTFFAISPRGVNVLKMGNCSLEDAIDNSGAWCAFGGATDFGVMGPIAAFEASANFFQCGSGAAFDFGTAGTDSAVIKGQFFNSSGHTGFITGGSNLTNSEVLANNVDTDLGRGNGPIFVGSDFPTDVNSEYNNNDGYGKIQPGRVKTVATLPAAAGLQGQRFMVTDANSAVFMATAAGGGSNKVPVISDGAIWHIG